MPSTRRNKEALMDAILPMIADPWMEQIHLWQEDLRVSQKSFSAVCQKNMFYLNAPHSCIKYICEVDPPRTRNPGDEPLEEGPLGNKEFNERHPDWDGYDYAYRIRSVHEIRAPITLKVMKDKYGFKGAPRSIVFVNDDVKKDFPLEAQIKFRPKSAQHEEGRQ